MPFIGEGAAASALRSCGERWYAAGRSAELPCPGRSMAYERWPSSASFQWLYVSPYDKKIKGYVPQYCTDWR
ncbi:hypothetical protein ACFWY6_17000 [Streptomyces sp. NPDC059037]|uniref:hypothetical protein n=1 Tax=Streptomyces sp. NPDC059037 TaxID=3346710 RepID=UPI00367E148C